jgi:hypothetical protein
MITNETAKTMTVAALHYTRLDLGKVVAVQEKTEREFPGSCPKLGQYWDELHAVCGEIKRRQDEVR